MWIVLHRLLKVSYFCLFSNSRHFEHLYVGNEDQGCDLIQDVYYAAGKVTS